MAGVSPAHVEPIPQEHRAKDVHHATDTPGPQGIAEAASLVFADVGVVAQAPANRSLGHLHVRGEPSTVEDREAQSGAERHDYFQALASDHPGAVDLRVIEHPDRDPH